MLYSNGDEDQMKKPDLVYAHNTNLLYAIEPDNITNRKFTDNVFL